MSEDKKKKLKAKQILWIGVSGIGCLLVLVSIVMSLIGVSVPSPTDSVQKYDCGSALSPVSGSLADGKYSTDIVCKDTMSGRRGNIFWLEVLGFVLSAGGIVMLVRGMVMKEKPEVAKARDE